MRPRSNFAASIAATAIALAGVTTILGCEPQGGTSITATGGTTGSATGGTTRSGGQEATGGTTSSGGNDGTGGASMQPSTGGVPGTGGDLGSGGKTGNDAGPAGGTPGSGGRTTAGGAPGSGGATIGTGGVAQTGGRTGMGNGGATAIGGRTGAGGATTATGGATSSTGGSTGGPPPATKKFFGNIDTQGQIRSDFKTMWDQFSPENAGKWGSVQGSSQSSFNWNSLDAMYKYCSDNNIIFKQHNFTWGAQQPGWVNSSNATAAIQNWMTTFCQRYPKTAMIDVVNEPLHNQASYTGGIGGAGSSGYDWIVNVFKWARTACPNAILIVNDYNTIEYSNENNNIQKLVKAVVAAGGPIDAVGNQGHDVAKVSASTVLTYTNNIINGTGLPVYITEMDIGLADDNQQQQVMQNIVTELWNLDKVKGFTYWGYIVGTTWRSNTGLMTSSGTKRAALTWLLNFLGR